MAKQCFACRTSDRFYIKDVTHFNKSKFGWCCRKVAPTTIHESCDNYMPRQYRRKRSLRAKLCLNDLLTEISELRTIIEEEYNEELREM